MSVIRFLHTDSLRLGSPIAGLAESPDWLRRVSASGVRTAVTNVIEAAVAGRCQLLLIAGRLTESSQDLEIAITWLKSQTNVLREHGIRLVIAGHSEADFPALRRLDAILMSHGQRLDVWSQDEGQVECHVSDATIPGRPGVLGIEIGSESGRRPLTDMAYVAVPSLVPSSTSNSIDGMASAHEQLLRISAGGPQSLGPNERGAFGCQIVEADPSRQTLKARACATDVIRFVQELIPCRQGMAVSQLTEVIRERSRLLATNGRRTTVVEWIIDGHLILSGAAAESLSEFDLLKELRASLHAGHAGAWPYRIRFSEQSTVDATRHPSLAAKEFSNVVRERMTQGGLRERLSDVVKSGTPVGQGSEATVGLDLLRRVA